LEEEVEHLKKTFRKNGYSTMEMKSAIHLKNKHKTPETKPTSMAIIPEMWTVSGKITSCIHIFINIICPDIPKLIKILYIVSLATKRSNTVHYIRPILKFIIQRIPAQPGKMPLIMKIITIKMLVGIMVNTEVRRKKLSVSYTVYMRQTGHEARMRQMRDAYKINVGRQT
jgi:hypothetical protein